ncbi:MAG: hypothetical protein GKS06_01905 [Acidobacteria bacterium]|nr:hypothetical protein [Acidobacteriota bacterium]
MNERMDSWDSLAERWRSGSDAPALDLQKRVRAAHLWSNARLWGVVALEVFIVLTFVAWTINQLQGPLSNADVSHLLFAWVTVLVSLVFAIRNRRGIWTASGETTADFLALCERRAERKLQTARFVARFTVALWVASVALSTWEAWYCEAWPFLPGSVAFFTLFLAIYLRWAGWFRRRAGRELVGVQKLRAELVDEGQRHQL